MSGHPARTAAPRARRVGIGLLVAAGVLAACGPGVPEVDDPLAGASTGTVPLPSNVGPADCSPPSPARTLPDGATEIEGAAEGPRATLWARLPGGTPPPVGTEFRVAWRIPGSSQLRLAAVGPDGEQMQPIVVAPTAAPGWTRPGDAWTSTFVLPSAGCWRLNAQRGELHGDIWFAAG
jgi:hypothetical protein